MVWELILIGPISQVLINILPTSIVSKTFETPVQDSDRKLIDIIRNVFRLVEKVSEVGVDRLSKRSLNSCQGEWMNQWV
jgi:hypothetical protein